MLSATSPLWVSSHRWERDWTKFVCNRVLVWESLGSPLSQTREHLSRAVLGHSVSKVGSCLAFSKALLFQVFPEFAGEIQTLLDSFSFVSHVSFIWNHIWETPSFQCLGPWSCNSVPDRGFMGISEALILTSSSREATFMVRILSCAESEEVVGIDDAKTCKIRWI